MYSKLSCFKNNSQNNSRLLLGSPKILFLWQLHSRDSPRTFQYDHKRGGRLVNVSENMNIFLEIVAAPDYLYLIRGDEG